MVGAALVLAVVAWGVGAVWGRKAAGYLIVGCAGLLLLWLIFVAVGVG
jgi:hypothetical protein